MIELIFALVIMGIVLMSAPMLINQSIRSGNVGMQQEAIAAAASQVGIILSLHWDENGDNNLAGVSPMMNINRAPFDLVTNGLNRYPRGLLPNVSGRRSPDLVSISPVTFFNFGKDESTNPDRNESDFSKFDDIDDYHNSNFGLMVFNNEVTTSDVGDYVDVNLTMNTQINYTQDRVINAGDTTLTLINGTLSLNNNINSSDLGAISNIKFIHINLTSNSGVAELDKDITMKAFSCNIGTTTPTGEMKL